MAKGWGGGHWGRQHWGDLTDGAIYPVLTINANPSTHPYQPIQLVRVTLNGTVKRYSSRELESGVVVEAKGWGGGHWGRQHWGETGARSVYERRLLREVEYERRLQDLFFGVHQPSEISIPLDNVDQEMTQLLALSGDNRGAVVELLRWDAAVGNSPTLEAAGTLSGFDLGDEATLRVSIDRIDSLLTEIPKGRITVQLFPKATDLGFAIPVVFGNVKKLPLAYIFGDLATDVHIYLVSYAFGGTPIFVYRDQVLVPSSEYTVYDGTYNNSVAGVGGNLTAYVVVVFTTEQRDFQGRLYDRIEGDRMTADVTGLAAERNFARAIRSILSNATWGLGETVDATTFNTAETDLDAVGGLFCDGWLLDVKPAKEYLDELMLVRGMRPDRNASGAWLLYVDKAATAYAARFGYNDSAGFRNVVSPPAPSFLSLEDAISTLDAEYRFDHVTNTYKALTSSRTVLPKGQPKRHQFNFVRDATTADKIVDYLAKRFKWTDQRVDVTVGPEARNLSVGDRIALEATMYGLSAGMEIRSIRKRMMTFDLGLARYSADPYTYTAGTLPAEAQESTGADLSHTAPAAPSTLTKPADGVDLSTDGPAAAWVDLSLTASTTADVRYVVQLRKNGDTNWTTWDESTSTITRIRGLVPGIAYDFQVFARSRQNLDSTVISLSNQIAPGDTTAPANPTGIAVRQGGGKSVEIEGTFTAPADWGTTILYRNTTNNSGTAVEIDRGKKKSFHDQDVAYGTTYYYWIKVADATGNLSGFSPSSSHSVTVARAVTDDLENNAVTLDAIYTNAASTSSTNTTELELATVTISTVGGSVVLIGRVVAGTGGSVYPTWIFRIRKDSLSGTIIDQVAVSFPSPGDLGFTWSVALIANDASPAASQTYKMSVVASPAYIGPGEITLSNRALLTFHRKK